MSTAFAYQIRKAALLVASASLSLAQPPISERCAVSAGAPGMERIEFRVRAGSLSLPQPQGVWVDSFPEKGLPFKFVGFQSVPPSQPLIVSPSKGVTPAWVWIGLSPDVVPYMQSGTYGGSLQFVLEDEPDRFCRNTDRPPVLFVLTNFSKPTVTSVVNAASQQPEFSPGTIITITGTELTTAPPGKVRYDTAGLYPTILADTAVYLNDKPTPLLYAARERIDAIIPHSFAGISTVDLVVINGIRANESKPFRLTLQPTSPGIYAAEGIGGALGVYNQDGTLNGEDHPAPKGAEIQIRANGVGVWNESLPEGGIALSSVFFPHYFQPRYPEVILRPKAPVSVTIGGQAANILNMGPVPYEIFGTLNIVAAIPDGLPLGPQPIVLKIGENDNSRQNVTVWVQ